MREATGRAHVFVMAHSLRIGCTCLKCGQVGWSARLAVDENAVSAADALFERGWRSGPICPECTNGGEESEGL